MTRDHLPVLPPVSECSGECCTAFTIAMSPDDLATDPDPASYRSRVAYMLVYLGASDRIPRGAGAHVDGDTGNHRHWYTCVHYDAASRRCLNYTQRPAMCAEYPYGSQCQYKGCSQRGPAGVEARSSIFNTRYPICPVCASLGGSERHGQQALKGRRVLVCAACSGTGFIHDQKAHAAASSRLAEDDAARVAAIVEALPPDDAFISEDS